MHLINACDGTCEDLLVDVSSEFYDVAHWNNQLNKYVGSLKTSISPLQITICAVNSL